MARKYNWEVIDKLTGRVLSSHRTYAAAMKAAKPWGYRARIYDPHQMARETGEYTQITPEEFSKILKGRD